MSPVEFGIDKAQNLRNLRECGCWSCEAVLCALPVESVILAERILEILDKNPELCFQAMMEEWSILHLFELFNAIPSPATVERPQMEPNGGK